MESFKNYNNCISYLPENSQFFSAENEQQIKDILEQCRRNKTPLYPVSMGNNWGYGAKAPLKQNAAVLSLKNMNQVLDFDSHLGLVRIQPGVTYGQLAAFLQEQGDQWIAPVHGGGPDCSVLGNVLERGFGITPIEDHFSSLQSLKAILPDGSTYESSYSSIGLNKLCESFQWGIGPYMDGIFTQSNFGIVTEICIRLARKQEHTEVWLVKLSSKKDLNEILNAIYILQRDHSKIITGVNLMNKERMSSMFAEYPEDKKRSGKPISPSEYEEMARNLDYGEWTLLLSIQGSKTTCKAVHKQIKQILKPVSSGIKVLTPGRSKILSFLAGLFPKIGKLDLKELAYNAEKILDILVGRPNHTALKLAYWMNEKDFGTSRALPDMDDCGLIWYSPILPMNPKQIQTFLDNCERISTKYGMNNLITFTSFNHLSFECTFPILFNKNAAGAAENAQAFYNELFEENRKIGCVPYRLPLFAMKQIEDEELRGSFALARKIKNCIDPDNIIAPGRYVF